MNAEALAAFFTAATITNVPRIKSATRESGIHVEICFNASTNTMYQINPPSKITLPATYSNDNVIIGNLKIEDFKAAVSATVSFTADLYILAPDAVAHPSTCFEAVNEIVSKFGAGETITINLKNSTPITLSIPSTRTKIVTSLTAKIPFTFLFTLSLPGTIRLANPFNCMLHISKIQGVCMYAGGVIGDVDVQIEGGVVVEGLQEGVVVDVGSVRLRVGVEAVSTLMSSFANGEALVSADTVVTCKFGGVWDVEIRYKQDDIPLQIHAW